MALQPVHEIAAIAPSHGTHAVLVDIREFGQGLRDGQHVLVGLAAPVLGDGTREVLSVARRSVRVGISHDVSRSGIHLPVSSVGVHPLHLRTTMDVDDERVFLVGVEVVRLDDEHVDGVATSSHHPHLLRGTDIDLLGKLLVVEGDLLFSTLALVCFVEVHGLARRGVGVVDVALAVEVETLDGSLCDDWFPLARLEVEFVERLISTLLCEEINILGVGAPFEVVHPVVELLCQDPLLSCRPVVEGKTEAVALIAGHGLEAVGDVVSVGRIERLSVPCRVLLGQTFCLSSRNGDRPEVAVGRCLLVAVPIRGEADLLAVGREGEESRASVGREDGRMPRARRHVRVGLVLQVADDDVLEASVLILRPMAEEQAVGDMGVNRSLLFPALALQVGLGVRTQVGIDRSREGHIASVGRYQGVAYPHGEVGQLGGLARGGIHAVELCRARGVASIV